jgi:Uma2 family endonuclease
MPTRLTHRQVTADELFRMPDDGFRYELVRGELRQMTPAGFQHGAIVVNVTASLAMHIRAHGLGVVCGAETGFRIGSSPDTVLAPDVAFVRQARLPSSGLPVAYWPGAPDLAVEVLSPGDTSSEVEQKIAPWLAAGTAVVWVVDPRRRVVIIHRAGVASQTLSEADTLAGDDIVPGLELPVAEIFAGS